MLRRRFIATLVVVFAGTALATPVGAGISTVTNVVPPS